VLKHLSYQNFQISGERFIQIQNSRPQEESLFLNSINPKRHEIELSDVQTEDTKFQIK